MAISKPTVRTPWADSATPNSADFKDPDTVTAGFTAAGWPLSSTPPARPFWNWVLNYCMNGIRYLCRRGIADWDSTETYASGGVVIGSDGQVYQSLVNSNINQAPPTSPSAWGPLKNYLTTGSAGSTYETISDANAKLAAAETFATNAANAAQGNAQNFATNADATVLSQAEGFAFTAAGNAQTAAIAVASNGSNISSGTVAAAHLPLIGNLTGIVIQADPGGTPSGFPAGTMVFYF
jgi:hypothetical protein